MMMLNRWFGITVRLTDRPDCDRSPWSKAQSVPTYLIYRIY